MNVVVGNGQAENLLEKLIERNGITYDIHFENRYPFVNNGLYRVSIWFDNKDKWGNSKLSTFSFRKRKGEFYFVDNYPEIYRINTLFTFFPEDFVTEYFAGKAEQYLVRSSKNLNEEVSNFEKQKRLIENLLSRFDLEDVCGFDILNDDDLDRVGSVMVILSGKSRFINAGIVKNRVRDILKKYLGLTDIYVGSFQVRVCK